ncbi:MAG: AMP-binding protein [Burkholderiaceae bacterium]|nr:AMP-binding protein [Burkholderiaceae bacterium]
MPIAEFKWRPTAEIVEQANLTRFLRAHDLADFDALNARANADPTWFPDAFIRFIDYRFYRPYEKVLDLSDGLEFPHWCAGGTTNVAMNCIDVRRGTPEYTRAVFEWEGEDGARLSWTFADVDREVSKFAWGLRKLGIGRGDVVGMYLPNLPQAAVTLLAVAKIGAIVMPLFSGFGADAIAQRMNDAGAVALVTVDGSLRRGKVVAAKPIADAALAQCPAARHQIVLRHQGIAIDWVDGRDHAWDDLVAGAPADPTAVPTEEMPADDAFMLVYTSGTTGKPKGVVHTHCGFPVKMWLDLGLCLDLKPSDRFLWMSDMGWLVGPLLVFGGLLVGATVVLIEGAPNFPEPDRLWRLVERHRISYLGVAPTTIRTLMPGGDAQLAGRDLSSLRLFVSTGEPWTPDAWNWLFDVVGGGRLPLLNFSGGTEMCAIVTGTVLHPLKPGCFAGPTPGTHADIVDENGNPTAPGEVGELVMRSVPIGLTKALWNDRERYLDTYWRPMPGLWLHGDFASRDADGMWFLHGRSDDTLKIAGKRTGPAEVESLLTGTGLLVEAAAIGVPHPIKGTAIVCVCVPRASAGEAEARTLSGAVVSGLGVPFRPERVVFVPDLPKTRNLKIMRRVIRSAWLDTSVGDVSSLVNPESVDAIRAAGEDAHG